MSCSDYVRHMTDEGSARILCGRRLVRRGRIRTNLQPQVQDNPPTASAISFLYNIISFFPLLPTSFFPTNQSNRSAFFSRSTESIFQSRHFRRRLQSVSLPSSNSIQQQPTCPGVVITLAPEDEDRDTESPPLMLPTFEGPRLSEAHNEEDNGVEMSGKANQVEMTMGAEKSPNGKMEMMNPAKNCQFGLSGDTRSVDVRVPDERSSPPGACQPDFQPPSSQGPLFGAAFEVARDRMLREQRTDEASQLPLGRTGTFPDQHLSLPAFFMRRLPLPLPFHSPTSLDQNRLSHRPVSFVCPPVVRAPTLAPCHKHMFCPIAHPPPASLIPLPLLSISAYSHPPVWSPTSPAPNEAAGFCEKHKPSQTPPQRLSQSGGPGSSLKMPARVAARAHSQMAASTSPIVSSADLPRLASSEASGNMSATMRRDEGGLDGQAVAKPDRGEFDVRPFRATLGKDRQVCRLAREDGALFEAESRQPGAEDRNVKPSVERLEAGVLTGLEAQPPLATPTFRTDKQLASGDIARLLKKETPLSDIQRAYSDNHLWPA
ncbi:unnamed protein product [Protopolystoma xenopodis]|uniref:Uncharacterized protein n=1 Tax=Protopolystoma xenopodis TaxID=117903 RepID=A0A448WCR6_9PLAT|nr:unnamed protein product [Protopolystoma xenopodis]